jgi:lysozyme
LAEGGRCRSEGQQISQGGGQRQATEPSFWETFLHLRAFVRTFVAANGGLSMRLASLARRVGVTALAAWMLGLPGAAWAIRYCPSATTPGIDVSSHQGVIDWNAVANAGIDFGIARISDGLLADSSFQSNYQGIAAAGLVRGGYQFFEPNQSPVAQATLALADIGALGAGDLPPTLDVEVSGGRSPTELRAEIEQWVATVRTATGRDPLIYTGPGFWNGSVGGAAVPHVSLWVANLGVSCPLLPNGFSTTQFWQFADNGSVAGVPGVVDRDSFYGSPAQLRTFAAPAVPEPRSWAMLIAGFGATGALFRRRRNQGDVSA